MVKRKYDGDNGDISKKNRTEEDEEEPQNVLVPEQPPNEDVNKKDKSRRYAFDIKHFRKELAAKQGQTMVLTQFLQVCLNPDSDHDYILQYLKTGGNSHEILRQIGQDSKKNLTLTTPAFHIFHLIILKVQSSLPHMITITEEACRYFLNTFMPTVEIMISENSGPRHRKVILKLLTSMVTLNPDLGVEVLQQAPLTPKHLQYIVEKANYKDKDNVRTSFVHFMTSFLVDGHLPLIKALLEKQGLLPLVIPGLIQDEPEAVLMFLNILKKNVVDNTLITKSLKLKTFSHQVLHNMFKLYSWKGPLEVSQEHKNEFRPEILTLLSDILLTLFTSHKQGLYFIDPYLGTTDANKNQNLYKAVLSLKRPWENEYERKVILEIVFKCLDLHRAFISVLEQSFEPQHSPIWERTSDFVIQLFDKLKPDDLLPRMSSLTATQVANFVRFISLPVPILKFIQSNIGKDKTISLHCIKIVVKMLSTLKRYIQLLEMEESNTLVTDIRNRLEYFLPKHLPIPGTIVSLIQHVISGKEHSESSQEYKLPQPTETESLITLVDLLLLYNQIHPAFFESVEGSLDMKKILDYSKTLTDGNIALLKFKIVSLWLTLDATATSLQNPMFKELFLIMLDVYTSEDENTWMEAKDTIYKFFKNTSIFESDEDEIHIMLYTLRNSKVTPPSLIGDIVEYVLANYNDLSDYIRNQILHFEISDESNEACLDKLFNDLMNNRSTDDSAFLESKVPSPFIVGCMQYLQSNRDVKKNLKYFLSAYVANLLHSNYLPELTEVLIGDSKLDVRNYVASWIGQPISLPDITIGRDDVLKNLSKSIIGHEDIDLNAIFTCLEQTEDSSDIVVNNDAYKIDAAKKIDGSELLIWAKYLVFCVIRLTNMNQLSQEQKKKIMDYLTCIIAIGKKQHSIDICRTALLNLFKNPQSLKIYKPLDVSKHESNILATEFLLENIEQHRDVVKYLDRKYKILKPYQQKNYNEIIKAFIKINKKKTVNINHTMKVLEIVGLSYEDDLLVFQQIFATDIQYCIKEDREPSVVLEILRVLIEKYTNTVTLELNQDVLNQIMKLYTNLLSNKQVIPNLGNLENSIASYFENKSYQVKVIKEEFFKQFFEANAMRKSTSHLASLLLQYNAKLCNIFKEQVSKPEILSQRELTLPLSNAVLGHKKFLSENKEFLLTLYGEYKSNIFKMLEKPHKAGQIYISCWKLIRKLLVECTDFQECEKFFSKPHKFETVEQAHIQLYQTVFLKMCLKQEKLSEDLLICYFLDMLNLITVALKEGKDSDSINIMISDIYHICCIAENMNKFDTTDKDKYIKLTESSVWQNFCKTVLKDSLRIKKADQVNTYGPRLLYLLTNLVKILYGSNHEDIVSLFDMVTSHSEFLNVMLSNYSPEIKSRLVELLYVLIERNESVMKSQHVPVYLSAYRATRTPCDRLILSIIHFYEVKGQPVNEYKPYLWGDSAANYYAVRKNRNSSLWSHPTPNQVFNLFEKDIIDRTIRNFPVNQKLEYNYELPSNINSRVDGISCNRSVKNVLNNMIEDEVFKDSAVNNEDAINSLILETKYARTLQEMREVDFQSLTHIDTDEGIYDPAFLFPLLGHLLAPGSVASCFKLLRTGLLSVPVMALSSFCPVMRSAAYHVLHRFSMLLETESRHKNDKLFLTDFVDTLRQSLSTAINTETEGDSEFKNPRLPAVDALYLAKALMISTAPFEPLYKPVNNFFIAKQTVDLTVVPDFLSLFHDSDVEAVERRQWILEVIRDGTKSMTDVNVIYKTMCLKMIMDFYTTVMCDRKTKEKILAVINSLVAIPRSFEIMVEGYGLLSWLHFVVRQLEMNDISLVKYLLSIIKNMVSSLSMNAFKKLVNVKIEKTVNEFVELKINKDVEHEVLLIFLDLVHHIKRLEIEDVVTYVRTHKLFSKKTVKHLPRNQIVNLLNKISVYFKDCEPWPLLSKALFANDVDVLKSKHFNVQSNDSTQILLKELTGVVTSYIA